MTEIHSPILLDSGVTYYREYASKSIEYTPRAYYEHVAQRIQSIQHSGYNFNIEFILNTISVLLSYISDCGESHATLHIYFVERGTGKTLRESTIWKRSGTPLSWEDFCEATDLPIREAIAAYVLGE